MNTLYSKSIIFILLIFPILFRFSNIKSQDSTYFFPHQVGDIWEYYYYDGVDDDTMQVFVIADSLDPFGNYHFTNFARSINPISPPLRFFCDSTEYLIDTLNQLWDINCYTTYHNTPALRYKLNAQKGDKWIIEEYGMEYYMVFVKNVWESSIFGINTTFKNYVYYWSGDSTDTLGWVEYEDILGKDFGLVWRGGGDTFAEIYLKGAVINGQTYGDTTYVGFKTQISSKPKLSQFQLLPNYPNPFNSETTIKFIIEKPAKIKLIIYNIQGKEVRNLIKNNFLSIGWHSIKWDGKNEQGLEMPSGIYLYKIYVGNQQGMRQMILIR